MAFFEKKEIMNFIGQREVVGFFDNAIENGRLSHCYCFVGPDGIGKRTLAKKIAAELLKVKEDKIFTHPDFLYLERTTDEKTGKLKKEISVGQARDLRARLQAKSWLGGYQPVIIDEAELLNTESSNALLKLLEEPGDGNIFFLLTTDEKVLLPTVRSRCQMFFFSLVGAEKMVNALESEGFSGEEARTAASISWGRPGKAIDFLNDEELRNDYYTELTRWEKMLHEPFYIKLKMTDQIFGDKKDHIRERGNLQKILDLWIMLWRDILLNKVNSKNRLYEGKVSVVGVENFSAEKICGIIDSLREGRSLLMQNIHPRLLLEQIFLKF